MKSKKLTSIILTLIMLMTNISYAYADEKITGSAFKSSNSSNISEENKKGIAANYAPAENFSMTKRKKIDLTLMTDYTGSKLTNALSQLNNLKAQLNLKNVDLATNIVSGDNSVKIGDSIDDLPVYRTLDNGAYPNYAYINKDKVLMINPRKYYVGETQMVQDAEDVQIGGYYIPLPFNNVNSAGENKYYLCKTTDGKLYAVDCDWYNSPYDTVYIRSKTLIKNGGVKAIGEGGTYIDANDKLYKYTRFSIDKRQFMIDSSGSPIAENVKAVYYGGNFLQHWLFYSRQYGYYEYDYEALGYLDNNNTLYGVVIKYDRTDTLATNPPPSEGKQIRTFKIADNVVSANFSANAFTFTKPDGSIWYGKLDRTKDSGLTLSTVPAFTNVTWVKEHDGGYVVLTSENKLYEVTFDYNNLTCSSRLIASDVKDTDGFFNSYLILSTSGRFYALYASTSKNRPNMTVQINNFNVSNIIGIKCNSSNFSNVDYQSDIEYEIYMKDGSIIQAQYHGGNPYLNYTEARFQMYAVSSYDGTRYYSSITYNGGGGILANAYVSIAPIMSLDISGVTGITPRQDSDRYFICLADGTGSNYTGGVGTYFSFGKINIDLAKYIALNRYAAYAVTDPSAYEYLMQDPIKQEISIKQLISNSPVENKFYGKNQFQQVLDYINGRYSSFEIIEEYALLNEEIYLNNYYSDGEADPRKELRYKITHEDPGYFENSLGTMSNSGSYFANPNLKFDKTGKYVLNIQAKDMPKNSSQFDNFNLWSDEGYSKFILYVHRKPLALFQVGFSGKDALGNYITDISEYSYDKDHESRDDGGITKKTWEWKKVTDTVWNSGLPAVLAPNADFLFKLSVQDLEGAWSDPNVLFVTTKGVNLVPTVDANPQSLNANANFNVTVTANDWGENDFNRTMYKWTNTRTKPASGWSTSTNKVFTAPLTNEGTWYLHMEVFDNSGQHFYRNRGPYKLVKNRPPTVDITGINPTPAYEGDRVQVNIQAGDPDIEVLAARLQLLRNGAEVFYEDFNINPVSGVYNPVSRLLSNSIQPGNYQVRVTVRDSYNMEASASYDFTADVLIDNLELTGYWNHWRGQVDIFGKQLTNEPHRFLSLECIRLDITTTGNPDRVTIRFSPELEAMEYTDPDGNSYNYSDYFGHDIVFPRDSSITVSGNHVYWEYNLPLAPSSKDWNDNRLRQRYSMTVTAYKGSHSVTRTIDDIDITGNIYDLTYIQPKD